jgi:cell division transport system permease protein
LRRWKYVLAEAFIGLGRNLLMSIAVILSVAVSLTLLGAALLLSREVTLVADDWIGQIEVSIFLCDGQRCPEITPEQQIDLEAQLKAEPIVNTVSFESKEDAYTRFVELFDNQPDLVATLNPGVLPASFRVKLTDPERFAVIADRFDAFPGVEAIVDQREVLDRLLNALNLIRYGAVLIALVQLVAGAVLIANTIRVAAFARREQTSVMKLVGASNWYIRLPFLLEGVLEGLIGGAVATLLLRAFYPITKTELLSVVQFVPFIGVNEVWAVGAQITLLGVGIAVVSSLLSLQRSLDV